MLSLFLVACSNDDQESNSDSEESEDNEKREHIENQKGLQIGETGTVVSSKENILMKFPLIVFTIKI